MGRYCKAYPVALLRNYNNWNENSDNIRKKQKLIDDNVVEVECALTDDDVLYLQENYQVTDGIFLDKDVVFDTINEEWKEYCRSILHFEVPVDLMSSVSETPLNETENDEE